MRFPWSRVSGAKALHAASFVAGLALLAGCSSEEAPHAARTHASAEKPAPALAPPSTTTTSTAETHHPATASKAAPTAQATATAAKAAATPLFWQRDPEAAFPNGGADYCAPVSLSGGLMYLTGARGMVGLTSGKDTKAQIALVKELAKDLVTDPKEGTSVDMVITGLQRFAQSKGYSFEKLEVATWRTISKGNEPHHIGPRPELEWIKSAVADPDTVVLANVGWYKKDANGYVREGGHWINVVGTGPQPSDLQVRNSLLKVDEQKTKTAVTLTKLDQFPRINGKETASMAGYYKVEGPGLPYGSPVAAAVLDAVLVFSPKKSL